MRTSSFETAVERHQERVFTFARYLVGNREEAEDVTQEVLIRLWQNPGVLGSDRLGAWLLRVTRNACYDRLRGRRTAHLRVVADDPGSLADRLVASAPDPERSAASAALGRWLRSAIDELGEPSRSIVILREIQGLAYQEIADALELPSSTVRVALHRARRRLRERLHEEASTHAYAG